MEKSKQREYFLIGCKLLGVYCFIEAIPTIFSAFAMLTTIGSYPDDIVASMRIVRIFSFLTPIAYGGVGIYLLSSSKKLQQYVYKNHESQQDIIEKFILFLKILGLYLLITYAINFLGSLSDICFKLLSPNYVETAIETERILTNLLPNLFGVGVGIYLIISGKFFINIGFNNKNNT